MYLIVSSSVKQGYWHSCVEWVWNTKMHIMFVTHAKFMVDAQADK